MPLKYVTSASFRVCIRRLKYFTAVPHLYLLTLNQNKSLLLHALFEGITFNILESVNVMREMGCTIQLLTQCKIHKKIHKKVFR